LVIRFHAVTLFPEMFAAVTQSGISGRALEAGLWSLGLWNPRDFTKDAYRTVDDRPYGGGPGMVMLAEPVLRCVDAIGGGHVVMTSPQGRLFTQSVALELAHKDHIVILCGRYEGFDERIREALQPDEISIGDFVVSGGELPAMLIADAVGRMIEGVVGNSGSVEEDSFFRGLLDYPHYTRPAEFRGMAVPEVLAGGNHEQIRKWRRRKALEKTLHHRPDLLDVQPLSEEDKKFLAELEAKRRNQ